jgi:hypothetical protein
MVAANELGELQTVLKRRLGGKQHHTRKRGQWRNESICARRSISLTALFGGIATSANSEQ